MVVLHFIANSMSLLCLSNLLWQKSVEQSRERGHDSVTTKHITSTYSLVWGMNSVLNLCSSTLGWDETLPPINFAQLGPTDVLLFMEAKPCRVDIVCPWADVSLRVKRWSSKRAESFYLCYYKEGEMLS